MWLLHMLAAREESRAVTWVTVLLRDSSEGRSDIRLKRPSGVHKGMAHGPEDIRHRPRAGIPHTTLSALFNHDHMPLPSTLKKLSTAMGVASGQLLVLARHLTETEYEQPVGDTDLARLYEVGDLDGDEWEQVLDFVRFKRNASS